MSSKLIQLPNFSYTSLDFDTIINDVRQLITEHPEYNQYWDDFLESNSGRMFVETMSWIIEKSSARVDWIAQEMFISTATQRQSIIDLLKLINHRPELPKAARVNVTLKVTKWVEPFDLPIRETIVGLDTTGNPIRFESLVMATDGKPDYEYVYRVNTGTNADRILDIANVPFYQGKTVIEDEIYLEGIDNEQITLFNYPVIENSIRIISITTGRESPEVKSFISPEAQQDEVTLNLQSPPYIVEIDDSNRAIIKFAHGSIAKKPEKNERFRIIYRIGGGVKTNVVAGAIKATKTYTFGNQQTSVIYSNSNPGFGGSDEERLEDAKLIAPISLRSANKLVTHEDYTSTLETSSLIMHANVVGKGNEPSEIYNEYGYKLPPLDTWIYVVPEREGWQTTNPYSYNKLMKISRPYTKYKVLDYEDIELNSLNQPVFLRKYKKNVGFTMYVTIHEPFIGSGADDSTDFRWLSGDSFLEGVDYNINVSAAEFNRITSADDGRIPAGETKLRVRYVENINEAEDQATNTTLFKQSTVKNFDLTQIIIDSNPESIYPAEPVKVYNIDGTKIYENYEDYNVDYLNSKIVKTADSDISNYETVIVEYCGNWLRDEDDISEQKEILALTKDKKMICLDIHVKDSVFTPFDVTATIYCYKNLRSRVQNGLEAYIRSKFNLLTTSYNNPVRVADMYSEIMNFEGVRFIEIKYMGTDYNMYRKYILDEVDINTLNEMGANKVEHAIPCKYNELLILAKDEYSGTQIIENKIHGLILNYKDA